VEPGTAALCDGEVWHRRNRPAVNEFTYRVSQVWIDPDHPEELTRHHRMWSSTGPAPARFRRSDYGLSPVGSLGEQVRDAVEPVLDFRPAGPVRLLTQVRRWGWLFNPISLFVLWHDDTENPVAAVAEVTNTPWKERTHYPVALDRGDERTWATTFDKTLHVSPFLDEDFRYTLRLRDDFPQLDFGITVLTHDDQPIVETAVRVLRQEPTPAALGRALVHDALSTRRVSLGIHAQALRLARKRVPFIAHPRRRHDKTPELKGST
jgi:DUF1365 family protein